MSSLLDMGGLEEDNLSEVTISIKSIVHPHPSSWLVTVVGFRGTYSIIKSATTYNASKKRLTMPLWLYEQTFNNG